MRCPLKILLAAVAVCLSRFSSAYTYVQVGIDSNFLVGSDRVVFAQSDGSLTCLALNTGEVLKRQKQGYFSGTLKQVPAGILSLQWGKIALLDSTNFQIIWETQFSYEPNVLNGSLISYDGNGLVQRRNLDDGAVRWTYNLPGALQVTAFGGRVLINRAATYDEKNLPILVLLDLENGKELFRKIPASGIHWEEAFLDGTNIYVTEGAFNGKRSDYHLENMLVWDMDGNEISNIPLDEKTREDAHYSDSAFNLQNKTFYKGHLYSDRSSIPSERFGKVISTESLTNGVAEAIYDLGDGFIFMKRTFYDPGTGSKSPEIMLKSPQGSWSGTLPYLQKNGGITAVAQASGKLLIGSNLGHVECIDAASGQSLWLYVFPTMRQTMSYSTFGMPPMMSEAAKIFRGENGKFPNGGLQLTNQTSKQTRVIWDPDPANPFHDLPRLLSIAWAGVVVPVLGLFFLHKYPRTRQWNLAFISLLLSSASFACFMYFGRVSPGTYVMLRVAVLLGLIYGVRDVINCFRRKQWFAGVIAGGGLLVLAFLVFPFLIRI